MSAASSSSIVNRHRVSMLSIDDALDGWRTDDKPPTTYTWWWLLTLTYSYAFLRTTLTSPKMAGGMFGDNNNGGKKIWRSNFEL